MSIRVRKTIVDKIDLNVKRAVSRYGIKPNLLSLTNQEYQELMKYKGEIKYYQGMRIEVERWEVKEN